MEIRTYEDLPPTPITTVPSTANKTGRWRIFKPILDKAKCINCLICWKFCPEPAIIIENDEIAIDYEHCKGCGICANECPKEAIGMEPEE